MEIWIGGLALIIAVVGSLASPQGNYLLLGTVLPALVFSFRSFRRAGKLQSALAILFLAPFSIAEVIFLFKSGKPALATLLAAGVLAFLAKGDRWQIFLTASMGFLFSARFPWWKSAWTGWSWRGWVFILLLVSSAALAYRAFTSRRLRRGFGFCDLPPILAFALGSVRIPQEFAGQDFFFGTTELLRQGGWLLWDTPSQYGILNLWLSSLIPAKSSWQGIYLLNSALVFASAVGIYLAARSTTRGWAGLIFSFLLSYAAVLLVPGWAETLAGPNGLPSVGAFRFIWCYALLIFCFWIRPVTPRALAPFVLFWVLGCLWSCESALCASAIAWPLFFLSSLEKYKKSRHAAAAATLLVPLAALGVCVSAIEIFYRIKLGHGPDWRCYFDYVLAYREGIGTEPIDASGAVTALIWAGVLILSAATTAFDSGIWSRAKWAIIPAFGGLWAGSSYFVNRGNDNNVLNIAPLWVLALLLAIFSLQWNSKKAQALRIGAIPLFVGLFMVSFGNERTLARYFRSLTSLRSLTDRFAIPSDAEAQALVRRAGVSPRDPLASFGSTFLDHPRIWLPIAPAGQLSVLPVERQNIYARRFLERIERQSPGFAGGSILEPKRLEPSRPEEVLHFGIDYLLNPYRSGLYKNVLGSFALDRQIESEHWRLIHFARIGTNPVSPNGKP